MKRTRLRRDPAKRLQRRRGLRANPNKPLRRATELRANPDKPLERTATLRPGRRRKRERTDAEREAMLRWVTIVTAPGVCAACGSNDGPWEGAHLVRQQVLERVEKERGLEPGTLLWDPDGGLCLGGQFSPCRCHPRHDLAVKRIPRDRLPDPALRFFERVGPEGLRELELYPEKPR
jgi:hypothetical protein